MTYPTKEIDNTTFEKTPAKRNTVEMVWDCKNAFNRAKCAWFGTHLLDALIIAKIPLYTQTLLYRKYQQFLSNLLQTKKDKLYFILREPLSQQINEEAHSSNEDV